MRAQFDSLHKRILAVAEGDAERSENPALGPANRVAVVNGETYEVENNLLVGQRVWQLAFTPDEKLLISTNGLSNGISVIDVARRNVITFIRTGRFS